MVQEVMPSPIGERVLPRIDPELKKKLEKAATAGAGRGKKVGSKTNYIFSIRHGKFFFYLKHIKKVETGKNSNE